MNICDRWFEIPAGVDEKFSNYFSKSVSELPVYYHNLYSSTCDLSDFKSKGAVNQRDIGIIQRQITFKLPIPHSSGNPLIIEVANKRESSTWVIKKNFLIGKIGKGTCQNTIFFF